MKTFAEKVRTGCVYFVAAAIIIAATCVSLSRMLTPYLNSHRQGFEQWASRQLQMPVRMGGVHITWHYYQPVLTFEQVAILDEKQQTVQFSVRQIKVNLRVLPSMLHWRPMLGYIKIVGVNVTVREQPGGQVGIEGMQPFIVSNDVLKQALTGSAAHNAYGGVFKANAVAEWMASQPRLILDRINLKYIPLHGPEKSLTLSKLSLVNSSLSSHALSGNIVLNQAIPLTVAFDLVMRGKVTDWNQAAVHAYFYVEGVSFSQWFTQMQWRQLQLRQGLGSAKIWVDWEKGQWQSMRSKLQIYDVDIQSLLTHKSIYIPRLNGRFEWKRDGDKQMISGEDILIDFPDHLWPTTHFTVVLAPDLNHTLGIRALQIGYLDMAESIQLAFASGLLSPVLEKSLNQLDMKGTINSLTILVKKNDSTSYPWEAYLNSLMSVKFSNLSFNTWQPFPNVQHVTGIFRWEGSRGGDLQLDSQHASFDMPALFKEPLVFNQLSGNLHFQKNAADGWTLTSNNLALANADLAIKTYFTLHFPPNDSPHLILAAEFSLPNLTYLQRYLPVRILHPEFADWLQTAFYGGQLVNGKAMIKGRLSDFPFDQNNGQFTVSANVNDLTLEYAPHWPNITHLNGAVVFNGHTLTMKVDSGQMLDIPLKQVSAEIPYLGPDHPQILHLQTRIHTDFSQALRYIQQSPLQRTFSKDLAALQVRGPMQLDLALSVPLKNPEKTTFTGDMVVPKADLQVPAWHIGLQALSGELHFTDSEIKATRLQAVLLGQPITLAVNSLRAPNTPSAVVVKWQGEISRAALQTGLHLPPTALYDGSTRYAAQLNISSNEQLKPSQWIVTSDLQGIEIRLPDRYGKKAAEQRRFQLTLEKQSQQVNVKLEYGNVLSAAMTLRNNRYGSPSFYSGELHLGSSGTAALQTKPGLLISGQFDQWDLNQWQGYISQLSLTDTLLQPNTSSRLSNNPLRGIDLNAKQLSLYGMVLRDARLQAALSQNGWLIHLKSQEILGQVSVPAGNKKTIAATFQYLHLVPLTGAGRSFNPKRLPAITFAGNDVRYKDMSFGNVAFNLTPSATGMTIQSLRASTAFYHLNARGEWRMQKDAAITILQGNLETKDIGKLLSSWGMKASNIVESSGTAQFNLHWTGAPYDPLLDSVTGNVSLTLSAGRIIDLSQSTDAKMGIGKMLNLFNLSSIPRRLTLNFKDFEKGYDFDKMQGNYLLKNGSLYTQDTLFDGPIARIEINGRIGYVAKDYNVNISVTPYGMTSSLPVVATVVGGPVAGAATWLVDKVVGGAVSNVITHRYTVQGSWSQPEWSEKPRGNAS